MKNRTLFILALAPMLLTASVKSLAADLTFSGSISSTGITGLAVLGTFDPGFDPYSYAYVYGIDVYGNMDSPNYNQAVADGNFRPIASADLFSTGDFSGADTAFGIEGEPLWVFVFDNPDPDSAGNFALSTGSDASWLAPPDSGSALVLANTATQFVFGSGGYGSPLELSILPFPEPATFTLLGLGSLALVMARRRK